MRYFISDLHLSPETPRTLSVLRAFLGSILPGSELFVLGDLFDAWVGDDDLDEPFNQAVVTAFRQALQSGVRGRILHGNRDFLIGSRFAEASGLSLIDEPYLIELGGERTVLLHGDILCADDHAYQAFRREVRALPWQRSFLALPLAERRQRIAALRRESESAKQGKPMALMDVSEHAVRALLTQTGATQMVHGHTHRPARHVLAGGLRWVLGEWTDGDVRPSGKDRSSATILVEEGGRLELRTIGTSG